MKIIDIIYELISNKLPSQNNQPQILNTKNGTINLNTFSDDVIYGEELRLFKDKLLECDEFKDCEMLEFLPLPIVQNKEGKPISAVSILLGEGRKFKGRCFL